MAQEERDNLTLADLPLTAVIGAFWMVVVAAPRVISFGPISLSGLLTVATAVIGIVALPHYAVSTFRRRESLAVPEPSRSRVPWALWGFLGVMLFNGVGTALSGTLDVDGIQNLCVYVSFIAAVALASAVGSVEIVDFGWRLLRVCAGITAFLSFVFEAAGIDILGSRPMAIVGLVVMAILIPGTPENRWMQVAPYAMVAAITLSLSRTATVVGLACLVFVALRGRRGRRLWRAVALVVAAIAGGAWLVTSYAPFRDRFLVGDAALEVGGVAISTQGRSEFWELLVARSGDDWFLGHGVGSASQLIAAEVPGQSHPHNEYLRFFFEFGWLGLALFLVASAILVRRTWANGRRSDAPVHWAAFIAMVSVGALALTDNPFVYPFVMLPAGTLVGFSLARSRFEAARPDIAAPRTEPAAPHLSSAPSHSRYWRAGSSSE